jgi:hypothetical protein
MSDANKLLTTAPDAATFTLANGTSNAEPRYITIRAALFARPNCFQEKVRTAWFDRHVTARESQLGAIMTNPLNNASER